MTKIDVKSIKTYGSLELHMLRQINNPTKWNTFGGAYGSQQEYRLELARKLDPKGTRGILAVVETDS